MRKLYTQEDMDRIRQFADQGLICREIAEAMSMPIPSLKNIVKRLGLSLKRDSSLIDLTGEKFGRLTVLFRAESENSHRTLWFCQCECGNQKSIDSYSLTSGCTKSCGCLKEETKKDLTGQRFGRLVALKKGKTDSGYDGWECQCDCGNVATVLASSLTSGGTKSCGCLKKERCLPAFKQCKAPGCTVKPASEFRIRKRVRKSGFVGQSMSEYCRDCERLRKYISTQIGFALKSSGTSKGGRSIFDKLPYTFEEYKQHIEAQFSFPENLTPDGKVWMNWSNRGKYDPKTWRDDDPSTQTWQIDHIKPQSEFHFTSMDDVEFQECWSLANQRPLSAKQNELDGARKSRHQDKSKGKS